MPGFVTWMVVWMLRSPMPEMTATERMMAEVGTVNHELAAAIDELTDDPKERSLLVAIARFEAGPSFAQDTVGDHGRSRGPYQRLDGPESFLWDAKGSTREALRQLRESWNAGRSIPKEERLSVYARGRITDRGRELSRPRVRMAMKLGNWH